MSRHETVPAQVKSAVKTALRNVAGLSRYGGCKCIVRTPHPIPDAVTKYCNIGFSVAVVIGGDGFVRRETELPVGKPVRALIDIPDSVARTKNRQIVFAVAVKIVFMLDRNRLRR